MDFSEKPFIKGYDDIRLPCLGLTFSDKPTSYAVTSEKRAAFHKKKSIAFSFAFTLHAVISNVHVLN